MPCDKGLTMQDFYTWEAEKKDGTVITAGESLVDCARFSLISNVGLPQHDLVGVEMVRRFCRGFIRGLGGGMKEYIHCVVCKGFRIYVKSSNGMVLVTPEDYELYL
jgi:hypothetical protein